MDWSDYQKLDRIDYARIPELLQLHKQYLEDKTKGQRLSYSKSWMCDINFSGCMLDYAIFDRCNLYGSNFEKSSLKHAIFKNCYLHDTIFNYANMEYALFDKSDLTNAIIKKANASYTSFIMANLTDARLRDSDFHDSNFRGSDLTGAHLVGTNIVGANFEFSSLPLWCGGLGMKVSPDYAQQIMCHFVSLKTNDPETEAIQKHVLNYAKKCHLVRNGSIKL